MDQASADQLIGAVIRQLRGELPQRALADEMRARGHRWAQATVWAVEKGDRPLRLAEAVDLAGYFGVPLDALAPPADPARGAGYRSAVEEFQRARERLAEARKQLAGPPPPAEGDRFVMGGNFVDRRRAPRGPARAPSSSAETSEKS